MLASCQCCAAAEPEQAAVQVDAYPSLFGMSQLPFLLSENVWEALEQQVTAFRAQQEESKRVVASIARSQEAFIAELHNFIKDRAQAETSCAETEALKRARTSDHSSVAAGSTPLGAEGHRDLLPDSRARTEATPEHGHHESRGMGGAFEERAAARESTRMTGSRSRRSEGDEEDMRQEETMVSTRTSLPLVHLSHYNNNNFALWTQSFSDAVVIPPMRDGVCAWGRAVAARVLAWRFFEPMMGLIIALNAGNIGWTINRELMGLPINLQEVNEGIFLGIFCVELALRILVRGWGCLKLVVNAFDFVLVVVTAVTQLVKPLLALSGSANLIQYLDQLMILRMMRLLRLARAVRLVASFNSLWKLVQGLVHCLTTMVSAMLLILICIYIFACFGAEFISKPLSGDSEVGHIISSQFSSLPQILLTLFQFISMDSTAVIYVPLIQRTPFLSIYFLLLVVVVAIALMNLITALIVEDAISSAQMDEEMRAVYMRQKLKSVTPALQQLFQSLDDSGDGVVGISELLSSIKDGLHLPQELQGLINPARMLDLFEALDSDHSGDLSEREFVEGLSCVALSDVPLETMQILCLLRSLRKEVRRFHYVHVPTTRHAFRRHSRGPLIPHDLAGLDAERRRSPRVSGGSSMAFDGTAGGGGCGGAGAAAGVHCGSDGAFAPESPRRPEDRGDGASVPACARRIEGGCGKASAPGRPACMEDSDDDADPESPRRLHDGNVGASTPESPRSIEEGDCGAFSPRSPRRIEEDSLSI